MNIVDEYIATFGSSLYYLTTQEKREDVASEFGRYFFDPTNRWELQDKFDQLPPEMKESMLRLTKVHMRPRVYNQAKGSHLYYPIMEYIFGETVKEKIELELSINFYGTIYKQKRDQIYLTTGNAYAGKMYAWGVESTGTLKFKGDEVKLSFISSNKYNQADDPYVKQGSVYKLVYDAHELVKLLSKEHNINYKFVVPDRYAKIVADMKNYHCDLSQVEPYIDDELVAKIIDQPE